MRHVWRFSFLFVWSALYANDYVANTLEKVDVALQIVGSGGADGFVGHISMNFSRPLYLEKELDEKAGSLKIYFPGMARADFEKTRVIEKIKGIDLVEQVQIAYERVPVDRVALLLTFKKDEAIVRINKMNSPHRLFIDVYPKRLFEALRRTGNVVLLAQNDSPSGLISDSSRGTRKPRVIVDAGHGGIDKGATGLLGIKEKDITLDIALRIKNLFDRMGYSAFLTRTEDQTMPLRERVQFATQLQADLYLSIHANSARDDISSGIETWYFDPRPMVQKRTTVQTFFAPDDVALQAIGNFEKSMLERAKTSQKVSRVVQAEVVKLLRQHAFPVHDRGVRAGRLKSQLQSAVPAIFVEVGFITHITESRLLAQRPYRHLIAQGIANGVQRYLSAK